MLSQQDTLGPAGLLRQVAGSGQLAGAFDHPGLQRVTVPCQFGVRLFQFFLLGFALRDVPRHTDDMPEGAIGIEHGVREHLAPVGRAVFAPILQIAPKRRWLGPCGQGLEQLQVVLCGDGQ
jgi:hypothetical protein